MFVHVVNRVGMKTHTSDTMDGDIASPNLLQSRIRRGVRTVFVHDVRRVRMKTHTSDTMNGNIASLNISVS